MNPVLCRRVWVRRCLGPQLKLMIKCYKSRCPESDYNRTKYRMRGFHSDTYFTVRVTYSTQHTLAVGCAHQEGQAQRG